MSTSMGLYTDKDMELLGLAKSGGVLAYYEDACYMYKKTDDKKWSDFGGKNESGETTRETIWREAAEEAGITESDVTKVYGTILGNGYVLLVVEVGVEPTTQRNAIETTSTVARMERFPSGYERHIRLNVKTMWDELGPMVREIEAAYEGPSHGFTFEDVGDDYNSHEEEKHGPCDPPHQYEDDAAEEGEDEDDAEEEGGDAAEEGGEEEPPSKKPKRPFGARCNWASMTRCNLEDVIVVTEEVQVDGLMRYAASPQAMGLVSKVKSTLMYEDEETQEAEVSQWAGKTVKMVIDEYLRNIQRAKKVAVRFKRDPIGEMLVKEGLITASRVYAYPYPGQKFPFSITQLPSVIRDVALGNNFMSCDDASAFHRIASTMVKHPRAVEMMNKMIEDKCALFEKIMSQGVFNSNVDASIIKEAIHALSNGQKISSTRAKLGDTGAWLNEWCHVQGEVTAELCSGEDAARAVGLIDQYFPKKKYTVMYEKKGGVSVLLKKPKSRTVKRDSRKTWRFFRICDVESQGMFAKMRYFKDNKIVHGPPIHDDVPFFNSFAGENGTGPLVLEEKTNFANKLNEYIHSEVPAYSRALVELKELDPYTFEKGVKSDKEATEKVFELYLT